MIRTDQILGAALALGCSACSTERVVQARRPVQQAAPIILSAETLGELLLPRDGLACTFRDPRDPDSSSTVTISLNRRQLRRLNGQQVSVGSHFFETPAAYDIQWFLPDTQTGEAAYSFRMAVDKETLAARLSTVFTVANPQGGRMLDDEQSRTLTGECQRGPVD
ncbi:hypothetical protein [Muricoccus vinaceus]|uniref:Uncharacterized protein n=1 Tax=Muricoccus vinaceus TaxID=424704 RepID=A0ABV6IQC4_9PROT